jgi:hypothetical protein
MSGTDTDHDLVEASIPYCNLNMRPPPPAIDSTSELTTKQQQKRLQRLTNDQRTALKIAMEEELGAQFHTLNNKLQELLTTTVKPPSQHRAANYNPADLPPIAPLNNAPTPEEI